MFRTKGVEPSTCEWLAKARRGSVGTQICCQARTDRAGSMSRGQFVAGAGLPLRPKIVRVNSRVAWPSFRARWGPRFSLIEVLRERVWPACRGRAWLTVLRARCQSACRGIVAVRIDTLRRTRRTMLMSRRGFGARGAVLGDATRAVSESGGDPLSPGEERFGEWEGMR